MKRPSITLTGADERTSIESLVMLADMGAEIGLLFSLSPEGRNRFPSLSWILEVADTLKDRVALHVCGSGARKLLFSGHLCEVTGWVGRVQVNGRVSVGELECLLGALPGKTIITQHNAGNESLLGVVGEHVVLVDGSGGRGLLPEEWCAPSTEKAVGFAGGLGPQTLWEELPKILLVAREGWWVDMEGKLRDADDWFDMGLATLAVQIWRTRLWGLDPDFYWS